MITITALPSRVIGVGRVGENEHRCVAFDISEYLAQYPDATFGLIHSPSGVTAYPVATVAVENDQLIWTVTSSDVTAEGNGRCELIVQQGDIIAKSVIYMTQVLPALDDAGEAPEPWESWQEQMIGIAADVDASADRAEAASEAVQNMDATATTLEPGAGATVTKSVDPETGAVTLNFGIPTGPQGPAGEPGQDGAPGRDGVSPTASVTQTAEGAVITVTDAAGTTTATLTNGRDGTDGQPGADGVSPTVAVTDIAGGHRVQFTDKSGAQTFDVMDGAEGQRGPAGQDGQAGQPGEDGFSPTASVSKSGSTATITITDKTGTTTAQVSDGQNGAPGQDGQDGSPGVDGTTFTPSVASNGDISWTNDGGKANPQTVNIKGPQGESGAMVVETVTGSTPTITAQDNTRYICGTVTTLAFTPSATGICDVRFTSGATATVLTVPSTVLWPDWFDPTALEANTTYELNVMDGVYGAVAVWT